MDLLSAYPSMSYMDLFLGNEALNEAMGALTMLGAVWVGIIALSCSGVLILTVVAKWNIFEKAELHGWSALVPFYGKYVLYKMTWGKGFWFLLSYIPGVSYVMNVITMVKLSCAFDKNSVFAVGLIFWPPIFLAILGFDDSDYVL